MPVKGKGEEILSGGVWDGASRGVCGAGPPFACLFTLEKLERLGSGGSMFARMKLKGIDGRAPPGVELAA